MESQARGYIRRVHTNMPYIYLKVCLEFEDDEDVAVNPFEFKNMILQSLDTCFGEVGKSIQVDVLKFNEDTKQGILRCPSKWNIHVYSAALFLDKYNEKKCAMRIQQMGSLISMAVNSRKEKLVFKPSDEVS